MVHNIPKLMKQSGTNRWSRVAHDTKLPVIEVELVDNEFKLFNIVVLVELKLLIDNELKLQL